MKFRILSDILYILRQSSLMGPYNYHFCLILISLTMCLSYHWVVDQLIFFLLCDILSVLHGRVCGLLVNCKSPLVLVPVVFSTSLVRTLLSVVVGDSSFLRIFLDESGLSFDHVCFFWASFYSHSQSVVDGSDFLMISIYIRHHDRAFSNSLFLRIVLCESGCLFDLGPYSRPNYFSKLSIPSAFLLCSIRFHILLQNCFVFLSSASWHDLCILPLPPGKIFFRCFWISCFVSIVLSCPAIFLVFIILPVPSDLFLRGVSFVLIVLLFFFSSQNI